MGILWIDTIKFPLFFISPSCVIFYRYARFLVGKSKNNRVTDKESKDFAYLCINLNDYDMSEVIIGRKAEQEILCQRIESKSPELIAIYGRRRIGKTYLVRQYFNDTFSF